MSTGSRTKGCKLYRGCGSKRGRKRPSPRISVLQKLGARRRLTAPQTISMQAPHAPSLKGCPADLAPLSPEKSLGPRGDATTAVTQCPASRMQMLLSSKPSSAAAASPSYPLFHAKIQTLRFPLHPSPSSPSASVVSSTVWVFCSPPPIGRIESQAPRSLAAGRGRTWPAPGQPHALGAGDPEPGWRGRCAASWSARADPARPAPHWPPLQRGGAARGSGHLASPLPGKSAAARHGRSEVKTAAGRPGGRGRSPPGRPCPVAAAAPETFECPLLRLRQPENFALRSPPLA